jgi:hypothetical protein
VLLLPCGDFGEQGNSTRYGVYQLELMDGEQAKSIGIDVEITWASGCVSTAFIVYYYNQNFHAQSHKEEVRRAFESLLCVASIEPVRLKAGQAANEVNVLGSDRFEGFAFGQSNNAEIERFLSERTFVILPVKRNLESLLDIRRTLNLNDIQNILKVDVYSERLVEGI